MFTTHFLPSICLTSNFQNLNIKSLQYCVVFFKVELPHPGEAARAQIMRIHSKKMKVDLEDVNFEELARCTEDFNGAQMKAVAVESGMIALRRLVSELRVVLC